MSSPAISSAMVGASESIGVEQSRASAYIDLQALRANAAIVRSLAGDALVCAVVKANAYGHGVEHVVPALLDQVDSFAVATLEEATTVRRLAPNHALMVLSEFNHPDQIRLIRELQVQPVIHHFDQIRWMAAAGGVESRCWLKVDSGMNRLGIHPGDVDEAFRQLSRYSGQIPGLMSHFACADTPEDPMNRQQLTTFLDHTAACEAPRTIANSAALAGVQGSSLDMVRAGLLLYGATPYRTPHPGLAQLRPVMQFRARVIAIRTIKQGERVGYGGTWRADKYSRIAIVSAGYADGYPRCLGNRGHVIVGGCRAPVVGMVSMDSMAVDISACGPVALGDEAELWGRRIKVETVADWADTIPYELLSQVNHRVARQSIDG